MKVVQKRIFLILPLLFIAATLPCGVLAQESAGIKKGISTIVIDPGHGGKDPGAVHGKMYEKDIVLNVALLLGKKIKENYPQMKVIYTRSTDKFIDLGVRGDIANKAKADLFLSIHINAAKNTAARGTETFVMGLDKQNANLELAMRENSVISLEDDYTAKYEGFMPNDRDSYIIFSLMQYANSGQSMQFASTIQRHYNGSTQLPNRGAKMGPFLVLWRTTMPSVLTELGFLSNEDDRKFLTTKAGQEKMATCLFNALSDYKAKTEGNSTPVILAHATAVSEPTLSTNDTPQTTQGINSSEKNSYFFCVQVCSSPKKVPKNSSVFKEYRGMVKERIIDGRYKYYVGECYTYSEAVKLHAKVKKSIKDAFLTAFNGDQQVEVSEAKRKLSSKK